MKPDHRHAKQTSVRNSNEGIGEVRIPKSRASTWWKIAGSALLLVAFGLQMDQSRSAASKTEKIQSAELDARSHIKSLGYENLYYSELAATGEVTPFYLQGTAEERIVGRAAMMATSGVAKDKILDEIETLHRASRNVKDLDSFRRFFGVLQDHVDSMNPSELNDLIDVATRARMLWRIYIAMYALGSCCVLWSQYLEIPGRS